MLLRTSSYSLKASSPITQVAPLATSRLTAAIAVTVLTGWVAQIDLLKNFAPGMIAMNPFTAGGLLAASIALFLRQPIDAPKERSIIGQLLASAIIAMGGLNLLFCSHNLVGPRWLMLPPLADGSPVELNGARISLSFVLIGASILSLNWKSSRGFRPAEAASAIVEAIAMLGARLDMTITAEGVETSDQLSWVRALGVTEVQGYFVSRPRPAGDIPTMLDVASATAREAA